MQHGLNPNFPDGQPSSFYGWSVFQAALIFAIVWGATVALTAVTSFSLPREFYSRVVMEVKGEGGGNIIFGEGHPIQEPKLQQTEFQVIQSKETLFPVIDNLKLADTWGAQKGGALSREEAFARLLPMLKVNSVRNTDLVEIGVFSTDRVEAANIANTIAITYQKARRDEKYKARDAMLTQLREEVKRQERKVEETLKEMLIVGKEENTKDIDFESVGTAPPSPRYLDVKAGYLTSKRVLEEAEARLSKQTVELKMNLVPIKIWEKAEPAIYPAKPDVRRILGLGAGVGMVLGLLAAGLFLGFARRG